MTAAHNSKPEAFLSSKKNRLKVYEDGKVYLKDQQEFEIELFNPTTNNVGARIMINEKYISDSMIVIRPGERVFLERYLDTPNRFKFETYMVENTERAKQAIEDNGDIIVEFYHEYVSLPGITWTYPNLTYGTCTTGTGVFNLSSTTDTVTTTYATLGNTSGSTAISNPGTVGNYFSNASRHVGVHCCDTSSNMSGSTTFSTSTIETGQVSAGSSSNQTFGKYNGTFNAWHFHNVRYKILPHSHLPVEVNKIRNYCSNCGTRIKNSSWKFCSNCGTKI